MTVSASGNAHPVHELELFRTVFPYYLPSAACPGATCALAPLSSGIPRGSASFVAEAWRGSGSQGNTNANVRIMRRRWMDGLDPRLRSQTGEISARRLYLQ